MKKQIILLLILAFPFLYCYSQFTSSASNFQAVQQYPSELRSKNWNYLRTDHGFIKFGPTNPGFAHIYTDMPRFIFNRDVYSYYGGFSAYNQYNLTLKTNGTIRMLVKRTNGFVGIGTTNPQARLEVNGNAKIKTDLNVLGNSTVQKKLNVNQGMELRGDLTIHDIDTNATPKSSQFLLIDGNGLVNSFPAADIANLMYEPCNQLQNPDGSNSTHLAPKWANEGGNDPKMWVGTPCPAKVGKLLSK